jgi:hypothetical protein
MEAPELRRRLAAILAADVEGYSRLMLIANVNDRHSIMAVYPLESFKMGTPAKIQWRPRPAGMGC